MSKEIKERAKQAGAQLSKQEEKMIDATQESTTKKVPIKIPIAPKFYIGGPTPVGKQILRKALEQGGIETVNQNDPQSIFVVFGGQADGFRNEVPRPSHGQ